jgi:flagellar protein FlaG
MASDFRINSSPSLEGLRAAVPLPQTTAAIAPKVDMKAAVTLAIDPMPVLHAPAKVNTEEMAQNLKVSIEHINNVLKDGGRGLSFVIDHALGQPIVKVTRAETGEVIRQYPNEAVVAVAHNIEKLKGVLFEGLI